MALALIITVAALGSQTGEARAQPAPPSLAAIIELVEIDGVAASPDGRRVAFRTVRGSIEANSYALDWHVADVGGGTPRRVAGGGAPIYADPGVVQAERPLWSPDSRFIHYRALIDGAIGAWRAAADGSGASPLLRAAADVEALTLAQGGGELVAVLGPSRHAIRQAEQDEYDRGILIDESVDLTQSLFRGAFVNGRLASQRLTGRWFDRAGLLWERPREQRRIDLQSLAASPVEPAPAAPEPPAVGSEPVLTVHSAGGDVARAGREGEAYWVRVRRAGGAEVDCADAACALPVVAMVWRPGHDALILTVQDPHFAQSLHIWDLATGEVRRLAGGDGLLSGGGRRASEPCAVTAAAAVCVAASPVSPPRLERIDLDTGERSVLFDPNSGLRATEMPSTERLEWSTPDGRRFSGVLLLPPGERTGRLPLFVNYYRCDGFLSGGVGDELPFIPLAGAGMASACINFPVGGRIGDGFGKYQAGMAAVGALVELLASRGIVDPDRVGMAGLSFGSEVTMWTAMRSDLLAAAAIASPQAEPAYYWYNAVRGRSQPEVMRRHWGLGSPEETPDVWRESSPAANVDRIRAPLLIQVSEQEAHYLFELYARLTRSPTPAEMYVFPHEGHLKVQPRHRFAAHERYVDWFRYWLQGHRDPEPTKAGQYRRWEQLAQRQRAADEEGR